MNRKITLLSAGICIFSFALTSGLKAQQSEPIVVDNVIKVNRRQPPKASKYYSGTSLKKSKKYKTKVVMMRSFYECPAHKAFVSKPQVRREKILAKNRKKYLARK